MTAHAKLTGIISVPLMMAMLGLRAFSSFLGGIRCILIAPGPSGFRVVCRTSSKHVSMYSLIPFTLFIFLKSLGTGIISALLLYG